jgi:hypothetical protein
MRTQPLPREIIAGMNEPPSDIQMIVHTAWLIAGIAIALAACTAVDEADLHAKPAPQNENVARVAPQLGAIQGNVQDMTY